MFEPAAAYRSATGATLSWWFSKEPVEAKLEILDASGTVIRTVVPGDPAGDPSAPRGRFAAAALPVQAGLTHMNWDLQTDPAPTFPGMILWGARTMA